MRLRSGIPLYAILYHVSGHLSSTLGQENPLFIWLALRCFDVFVTENCFVFRASTPVSAYVCGQPISFGRRT